MSAAVSTYMRMILSPERSVFCSSRVCLLQLSAVVQPSLPSTTSAVHSLAGSGQQGAPVAGLCRGGRRGGVLAAGSGEMRCSGACVPAVAGRGTLGRPWWLRGGIPVGVRRGQERQQRRRLAQRWPDRHHRHQAPVQHRLPRSYHLRSQPAASSSIMLSTIWKNDVRGNDFQTEPGHVYVMCMFACMCALGILLTPRVGLLLIPL